MNLEYRLENHEYLEAEQLKLSRDGTLWLNLSSCIVLIITGLFDLQKVSSQDLHLIEYLREWWVSDTVPTNYIASALFYFALALLVSSNTLPKYNPLNRWLLSRQYRQSFVKQETQSLTVDKDEVQIVSENCRRFIQWQDFTQWRENKQIFLLCGSTSRTNVIIPKRVCEHSEIESIRTMLSSKIESQN